MMALMDSFGDDEGADDSGDESGDQDPVDQTGVDLLDSVDTSGDEDVDADGDAEPLVNEQSFTDGDDEFTGTDAARQFLDMGAGNDAASGGRLSDVIQGGSGADTLSGGGGGDYLYADDANSASASDEDVDFLDGGAGADYLYFGNGDVATGGSGEDIFTLRQDLDGNATITDFDSNADTIVFETDDPEGLSIAAQIFTDTGMIIELSNGATLTLEGAEGQIEESQISFQEVIGLS